MDLRWIYLSFLQRTKPQAQHRLRCRLSGSDSSPSSPDQQQQLPGYEPLGGWVVPGAAAAAAAPAALMGNGIATKVGSAPSSQQIDTIAKKASQRNLEEVCFPMVCSQPPFPRGSDSNDVRINPGDPPCHCRTHSLLFGHNPSLQTSFKSDFASRSTGDVADLGERGDEARDGDTALPPGHRARRRLRPAPARPLEDAQPGVDL